PHVSEENGALDVALVEMTCGISAKHSYYLCRWRGNARFGNRSGRRRFTVCVRSLDDRRKNCPHASCRRIDLQLVDHDHEIACDPLRAETERSFPRCFSQRPTTASSVGKKRALSW